MQHLYQMELKSITNLDEYNSSLEKWIHGSTELFKYLIYLLVETATYADKDASNRARKNIVTSQDLDVSKKILGNTTLKKILASKAYIKNVEGWKPAFEDTDKMVRHVYNNLSQSVTYQAYIETDASDEATDRELLNFLFGELIVNDELVHTHLCECYCNWEDEWESMHMLMLHFFKKPQAVNLNELLGETKWQYAKDLMNTVVTKKEVLTNHIVTRLKNWDPERIAILDMILLKMGVSEFLFFETIPPKVTLNEYIDLAKAYSTAQSGQFVNGVLDSIHKELIKNNMMHKTEKSQ